MEARVVLGGKGFITLIALALALAACSSARPPATHAPAHPRRSAPGKCGPGWPRMTAAGMRPAPTVRHDLYEVITAARDYGRRSPDSSAASGDMGTESAEFQRLSYVPDPPACADPGGRWQILMNNISFAGGGNGDSSATSGMRDIPGAVGYLNGELRHTTPGVQISPA